MLFDQRDIASRLMAASRKDGDHENSDEDSNPASSSSSFLLQMMIAALIPYMVELVKHVVNVVYPNALFWWITSVLLRREVTLVEDFQNGSSSSLCKTVTNGTLIDAIALYCAHLHEKALEERKRMGSQVVEDETEDMKEKRKRQALENAGRTAFFHNAVVPTAEYRYSPRMLISEERGIHHNHRISALFKGNVMADYLRRHFTLFVIPSEESAMEVEPGLFVRFEDNLTARKKGENLEETDEQDEEQRKAAKRQEDFWLSDMMNMLREGENAKQRGPFDHPDQSEDEQDDDNEEDDSDDDYEDADDEALEDKPVRRIFIRCCEFKGTKEREAYNTWFIEEKKRLEVQEQQLLNAYRGKRPSKKVVAALAQLQERMRRMKEDTPCLENGDALDPRSRIDFFVYRAQQWYYAQQERAGAELDNSRYIMYIACTELQAAVLKAEGESFDGRCEDDSTLWDDCGDESTEYNGPTLYIRRYHMEDELRSGTAVVSNSDPVADSKVASSPSPFSSLFFPQREKLEELLYDFTHGTGVYTKPGYPQRLHILISSDGRGAGTTSIVKAIARYLQRSIMVLSLQSIMTNNFLKTWLTPLYVKCAGEKQFKWYDEDDEDDGDEVQRAVFTRVRPADVVYLMEDIEKVGCDEWTELSRMLIDELRQKATEEGSLLPPSSDPSAAMAGATHDAALESTPDATSHKKKKSKKSNADGSDSDGNDADETEGSTSEDRGDDDSSGDHSSHSGSDDSDDDSSSENSEKRRIKKATLLNEICAKFSEDRLTVEGTVSILHPKLPAPQRRVVILTTSKPLESLDPRWFTPMLLNMHIRLETMKGEDVLKMVQHHGFHPSAEEKRELLEIMKNYQKKNVTPPMLLEYCAECESVTSLLEKLRHSDCVPIF